MHFASSLLKFFPQKYYFQNFAMEHYLMLSRCCFHYLVANSILYKKKVLQHFYIGTILFLENKIILSVIGRKVDGQILFGARSEKRKNSFRAKWQLWTNLFGSQRVKQTQVHISLEKETTWKFFLTLFARRRKTNLVSADVILHLHFQIKENLIEIGRWLRI